MVEEIVDFVENVLEVKDKIGLVEELLEFFIGNLLYFLIKMPINT